MRSAKTQFLTIFVAATVIVSMALGANTQVGALNPQPEPPIFISGLFAITPLQTVRINLVTSAGSKHPGYEVLVRIIDPEGQELKSQEITLLSGKTAFVDYRLATISEAPAAAASAVSRSMVQVEVQVLSGFHPKHYIFPTLEIFNSASGETTLLLPLINPQPEPPLPAINPQPEPPKPSQ